jgi:hypothetical protein
MSHKIANILEKHLKHDPHWQQFCEHLAATKVAVQQTDDLAALMPPKQRSKARYMNADVFMNWVTRFQESRDLGYMDSIPRDRFDKYFGWLDPLETYIESWKQMIEIGEIVKKRTSVDGFSHKTYLNLEDLLNSQFEKAPPKVIDFIGDVMESVWNEVEQLKPRQAVIADTRIAESIFGKFKQSLCGQLQGVTLSAVSIAAFTANHDMETVRARMEAVTVKEVLEWGKACIGESLTRLRRKFFPQKKRNKNSENSIVERCA